MVSHTRADRRWRAKNARYANEAYGHPARPYGLHRYSSSATAVTAWDAGCPCDEADETPFGVK